MKKKLGYHSSQSGGGNPAACQTAPDHFAAGRRKQDNSMKLNKLALSRLNEVKPLLFRDRLVMHLARFSTVHGRLRLDTLTRLWLAVRL